MRNRMLLLGALAILVAAPAMAFHDGGVADCQGCHTMHNSQGGQAMNLNSTGTGAGTALGTGWSDLLLYESASDVCLDCHASGSRSVFTDPASITTITARDYYAAGNFVFLLEDNINDGHNGASNPILGEEAGHNIFSNLRGSDWDSINSSPPGNTGNLGNNELHCSSCHDPHGNDSYRLLYRTGQTVDVGGQTVAYGVELEAEGISASSSSGETDLSHNAYHAGYSEWCGTCHGDFHAAGNGTSSLMHPSGQTLSQAVVDQYNAYDGTADCIANDPAVPGGPCGSGVAATAYLADVPFEDPSVTTTSTAGPTTSSKVACVSCHRAHATSARDAGRWDFMVSVLGEDGVESGSYKIANSYGDFGQRSLCNKCHGQDEFDEMELPPAP